MFFFIVNNVFLCCWVVCVCVRLWVCFECGYIGGVDGILFEMGEVGIVISLCLRVGVYIDMFVFGFDIDYGDGSFYGFGYFGIGGWYINDGFGLEKVDKGMIVFFYFMIYFLNYNWSWGCCWWDW